MFVQIAEIVSDSELRLRDVVPIEYEEVSKRFVYHQTARKVKLFLLDGYFLALPLPTRYRHK